MSKISAFACWLGVLGLLGIVPALHAAEEVTLKNGFNLLCDHREQAGDKVRLFTSQGSSNFVEVDAAEIASVDTVPDPASGGCAHRGRRTPAYQRGCARVDCPRGGPP